MKSKVAIMSTVLLWLWTVLLIVGMHRDLKTFSVQIAVLALSFTVLTAKLPRLVASQRMGSRSFNLVSSGSALLLPLMIYSVIFFVGAVTTPSDKMFCGGWMDSAPYGCSMFDFFKQTLFFGTFVLWPILFLEVLALSFAFRFSWHENRANQSAHSDAEPKKR